MLNAFWGTDEPSIFESDLVATVGGGGIDVNVSVGDPGYGGGGYVNNTPPQVGRGINILGIVLIGVLLWIALK